MKPAPFTYHDPRSVSDAVSLLGTHENARVLAGGQSLMPMMNFRYAMPDHLIDLNKVSELAYIRVEDHTLKIGAMTRQRDIEFSSDIGCTVPCCKRRWRMSGTGKRVIAARWVDRYVIWTPRRSWSTPQHCSGRRCMLPRGAACAIFLSRTLPWLI